MKLMRFFVGCMFIYSISIFATSCVEQKGYQNQIEKIQEISTNNVSKFIITFQHDNPICNWVPKSYRESLDESVHRFLMPRTTVADGVKVPFDMQSGEWGTELVFYAQKVSKIINGKRAMFVVKQ